MLFRSVSPSALDRQEVHFLSPGVLISRYLQVATLQEQYAFDESELEELVARVTQPKSPAANIPDPVVTDLAPQSPVTSPTTTPSLLPNSEPSQDTNTSTCVDNGQSDRSPDTDTTISDEKAATKTTVLHNTAVTGDDEHEHCAVVVLSPGHDVASTAPTVEPATSSIKAGEVDTAVASDAVATTDSCEEAGIQDATLAKDVAQGHTDGLKQPSASLGSGQAEEVPRSDIRNAAEAGHTAEVSHKHDECLGPDGLQLVADTEGSVCGYDNELSTDTVAVDKNTNTAVDDSAAVAADVELNSDGSTPGMVAADDVQLNLNACQETSDESDVNGKCYAQGMPDEAGGDESDGVCTSKHIADDAQPTANGVGTTDLDDQANDSTHDDVAALSGLHSSEGALMSPSGKTSTTLASGNPRGMPVDLDDTPYTAEYWHAVNELANNSLERAGVSDARLHEPESNDLFSGMTLL